MTSLTTITITSFSFCLPGILFWRPVRVSSHLSRGPRVPGSASPGVRVKSLMMSVKFNPNPNPRDTLGCVWCPNKKHGCDAR